WQQLGSWTIAAPAVTNTSVTPAAGSGAIQSFTEVFTDTGGAADLASASLSVVGNSSGSGASSCAITWTRVTGQFNLLDDAGAVSFASQNSQCSVAMASARASDSGNTLTLTLPITFTLAFGGTKGLWMTATGTPNGSALQQLGSWTSPSALVTNTSVSPN